MKYFFPDSQDLVDPSFNFTTERRDITRLRQRDDCYPHEIFAHPPYDGMLISRAIVDERYTLAQKQRLLRLGATNDCDSGSRHRIVSEFQICVVGFIARDEKAQREHFIRVNSAKPLPKDLIDELIPETENFLDTPKEKRRFPLHLRNLLNINPISAFKGRIKTPTTPAGYIASATVLKMLDNSLSNGVLFRHRRIASDDIDSMLAILANFWGAIQLTFPKAWELPPNKSRLTHGAGIISMGLIMDAICDRLVNTPIPDEATFVEELRKLRPHCKWTEGTSRWWQTTW